MNLQIFNHNEIVQVLDETTYIWEAARILGLDSDWSAKVKWVEWSSKPAIVITVPETLRAKGIEYWNIRKFQKTEKSSAIDKRSRRNKRSDYTIARQRTSIYRQSCKAAEIRKGMCRYVLPMGCRQFPILTRQLTLQKRRGI